MTLLGAAVTFVGCLCLIDLLLTFGVLRRLREHAELLADKVPGLATGERPQPFVAISTTGQAIYPDGILAVVATETGARDYITELSGAASVCLEPHGGSVGNAFQIKGFPSFFLLNADGTIVASAFDPDALPIAA